MYAKTFQKENLKSQTSKVMSDLDIIPMRYYQNATEGKIKDTLSDISHNLSHFGIHFEKQSLPVSLMPTVLDENDVKNVSESCRTIRQILNKVIHEFVKEHRLKQYDGPFHRFFTPYYKWWDLIAKENRRHEHIQLMRYDAIRDHHGSWSFMETNTACPGGTIHCARVRNAWMMTRFGRTILGDTNLHEYMIDKPSAFVEFLDSLAKNIDPQHPNIAILNYKGTYTNEIHSLQKMHQQLRSEGLIERGELLLGDIRDITYRNGQAYLRETPISLIYNKIDQLQIDPKDEEIHGWIQASTSEKTEFLNSLGAMYLTESKRILALLTDPQWSCFLNLTEDEQKTINDLIPQTRLVEDLISGNSVEESSVFYHRVKYVLKADSLTRGSGICIGERVDQNEWIKAIRSSRAQNSVVQVKCNLPSREVYGLDSKNSLDSKIEYYGVDFFLFGDQFAGAVGRSHTQQIFNVGNGGCEVPVFIVRQGRSHA